MNKTFPPNTRTHNRPKYPPIQHPANDLKNEDLHRRRLVRLRRLARPRLAHALRQPRLGAELPVVGDSTLDGAHPKAAQTACSTRDRDRSWLIAELGRKPAALMLHALPRECPANAPPRADTGSSGKPGDSGQPFGASSPARHPASNLHKERSHGNELAPHKHHSSLPTAPGSLSPRLRGPRWRMPPQSPAP